MANTFTLAKNYTANLDEVYKLASTTNEFTSGADMVRQGMNAKEILIPKMSMDGLKDYDRNAGYKSGNVKIEWETKSFNYDRGTKFEVDWADNEETLNLAFGQLGAEFVRTRVAPEADAFFYAKVCGATGISKKADTTFTNGEKVLDALVEAMATMDEDEVPVTDRHLRITPTLLRMAQNEKTYINSGILDSFASVVPVPQTRFYTQIDLLDGTSSGEEVGGYKKTASTGADINFLIIHKPAVIKFDKHVASDIIDPSVNQDSDAYILKYRKYGMVETFANKVAGIYLCHKTAG